MSSGIGEQPFISYPEIRQGPAVPYKNEDQSIPVFRGTPLVIGASLISNVGFVQSYFWRNAGFDVVRHIPSLDQYPARYDPTVIPVHHGTTTASQDLPAPTTRRSGDNGYYTSADYHALYTSGELTPTAVVDAILPVVRRDTNPPGKHSIAFLECAVEKARAAAEESTQRYKNGQPLGPLDGIPVTVKDEVHMEGYRRTLGTKMDFTGDFAGSTSWCVKKWEEAGAIVIAKSTMHELGLDTTNNNPNFGTPKNPHNPNYYTGGSSGGSAYAVGAGIVPIALGADGGGSIRIPSSFCGVWGLKPSHSRVSGFPTAGLATTVGVLGPIASSIDDLALAYRIMATPASASDDSKSSSFPHPLIELNSVPPESRPKNKTIGIMRDWLDRAEPAVRAVFDRALDYYRTQKNYTIVDTTIPYIPEGARAHVLTIMAEIASGLSPSQISKLTAPNKVLVSMGMHQISSQEFLAAQRVRGLLMSHLGYLFQKHPGLLIFTPTTPIPGWKISGGDADLVRGVSDGKSSVRNMEYVWLANFTGCPAINCPAGYAEDNGHRVPIGIMAMGEWGSEEDLIAFARDGEGILNLPENKGPVTESGEQATGLTIPRGADSLWEDVVGNAKAASSS
ncbi:amidase signature domain-containing protein [Aspergillus pseudodeflectus]|uniref:Amidase signature domain-containing protein n=1 Tax=Aspergillus pseudodeflectus TaxID=176178 RepID=A0ABR4K6X4_9EURO